MTNEDLIEEWIGWLEAGNAARSTIELRRMLARTFARQCDLLTATPMDVQRHLLALPGGAWSRRSHLATLRSLYKYAVGMGYVERDPTALTHSVRIPPKSLDPIPDHVLAVAMAAAPFRVRRMLALGSLAGLRRAEIACLHSSGVSDTHLTIVGKGGRCRVIPIHPALRPYLDFEGWAFPSPVRPGGHLGVEYVGEIIAGALPGPWTAHSLRRSFATRAFDLGGKDIRAVQELLGHSSPATTAKYVKANRSAMEAAVLAVA